MPGSFRSYGKIDPYLQFQHETKKKERRRILIIVSSSVFLTVAVISLTVGIVIRGKHTASTSESRGDGEQFSIGSAAIQAACNTTVYPDTCRSSLSSYPGALNATPSQLVAMAARVAVDATTDAWHLALGLATERGRDPLETMALEDCAELLEVAIDHLNESAAALSSLDIHSFKGSLQFAEISLSTASSDQSACTDGLNSLLSGRSSSLMLPKQEYVSQLIINALCLVETLASLGADLSSWKNAIPSHIPDIFHLRRRLLSSFDNIQDDDTSAAADAAAAFPRWLSAADRRFLEADTSAGAGTLSSVQPDLVVDKSGKGDYTTLKAALKNVPEKREGRFVILIKAGVYDEGPLNISKSLANLSLIGEGCNATFITGDANVASMKYTTYRSATLGISAKGFMARHITFRNEAGPAGQQAVAVRAQGDQFVLAECCLEGYQDTLYALSGRQFYRDCKLLGTVDYIFGNALAVFQSCELRARQPMQGQQNTYTAQGRKQRVEATGFAFQHCNLTQAQDLASSPYLVYSYYGRPWKPYSTSIFLQSYIGPHLHPDGWLSWNLSRPHETTCTYAEYDNYGPGSNISHRVDWPCVTPQLASSQAQKYTVASMLSGGPWIPSDVSVSQNL